MRHYAPGQLSLAISTEISLEQLQDMLSVTDHGDPEPVLRTIPRILCADGFSISVQANEYVACHPRNRVGPYTSVECAMPNRLVPDLMPYILEEEGIDPLESVYRHVPVELVISMINEHGGMI